MDRKEIVDYLAKKLFSGEINPPPHSNRVAT